MIGGLALGSQQGSKVHELDGEENEFIANDDIASSGEAETLVEVASYMLNNSDKEYTAWTLVEDLTNDGAGEIILGTTIKNGTELPTSMVGVYSFQGNTISLLDATFFRNESNYQYFSDLEIFDVDGDGTKEILHAGIVFPENGWFFLRAYNFTGGALHLEWERWWPFPASTSNYHNTHNEIAFADFDNDGTSEICTLSGICMTWDDWRNTVRFWTVGSTGPVLENQYDYAAGSFTFLFYNDNSMQAVNLDTDPYVELLTFTAHHTSANDDYVALKAMQYNGSAYAEEYSTQWAKSIWAYNRLGLVVQDIDGDGTLEILTKMQYQTTSTVGRAYYRMFRFASGFQYAFEGEYYGTGNQFPGAWNAVNYTTDASLEYMSTDAYQDNNTLFLRWWDMEGGVLVNKRAEVVTSQNWDKIDDPYAGNLVPNIAVFNSSHIVLPYSVFDGSDVAMHVKVFLINEHPIPPTITSPPDITYMVGAVGNEISWTITDTSMASPAYSIYRNGTLVDSNTWVNATPVVQDIDGLDTGVYNYTVVASDGFGSSSRDTVLVTVVASPFDALEMTTLVDIPLNIFDPSSPRVVLKYVPATEENIAALADPAIGVNTTPGFKMACGFLAEINGIKNVFETSTFPSYALDFIDFFLSEDGVFRIFYAYNFLDVTGGPTIDQMKDITELLVGLIYDGKSPAIASLRWLYEAPGISELLHIGEGTNQYQLKLEPTDFLLFLDILKMFVSFDVYILNTRSDGVKPLKIVTLSDCVNFVNFVVDVLKLFGKVGLVATTGGVAGVILAGQIGASAFKIAYQMIVNPPSFLKALVERFLPDIYSLYETLVDWVEENIWGIYVCVSVLDPPTQRLDFVIQDDEGKTILGYDPETNTTINNTSWGAFLGNREFQILYIDGQQNPSFTLAGVHSSWGIDDPPIDFALDILKQDAVVNQTRGVIRANASYSTGITLNGTTLFVPSLNAVTLSETMDDLRFLVINQDAKVTQVESIEAYVGMEQVDITYEHLGNGIYKITSIDIDATNVTRVDFVFFKASYLPRGTTVYLLEQAPAIGHPAMVTTFLAVFLLGVASITWKKKQAFFKHVKR